MTLALPARCSLGAVDSVSWCDALVLLGALADDSVDVTFADPPYNNGTSYDGYSDSRADYKDWCAAWFKECRRVSKRVVITPGHGNIWMWGEIEKPLGIGCWHKPGNPASSILGWETWEAWLYWAKGAAILGGPSAIEAPVFAQKDTGDHPCPKPLLFLEKLLLKVGKPGCVVLDPFCGSGTTLVAARKLGMRYIGCDQSAKYVLHSRKRLAMPFTPIFPQMLEVSA